MINYMIGFVVIIVVAGIALTLYIFILSFKEGKEKHQKENSLFELKQQVISLNVKLQNAEFENSSMRTETDKLRTELKTIQEEQSDSLANENALKEDLQSMRIAEDNIKMTLDTLKAENESLKETLMKKENENKKLSDEIIALKEKIKSIPSENTKTRTVTEKKQTPVITKIPEKQPSENIENQNESGNENDNVGK